MKGLNEYKAEIFRRSESRIKERRRNRNRVLALCIPLCLILVLIPAAVLPAFTADSSPDVSDSAPLIDSVSMDDGAYNGDTAALGSFESFSFSLVWNCYGVSSYDSETGRLIKTTDATNPEDYITHCELTEEQMRRIYELIKSLDVGSYPDIYNPHADGFASSPTMTLILSVKTDTLQKTISAVDIAMSYDSQNARGKRFLDVCKTIEDILTATDEWKALPDYEFYYI